MRFPETADTSGADGERERAQLTRIDVYSARIGDER